MENVEPLKILIADDTDTDRMLLERIVAKQGHNVITACDGVEAVDAFKREKPDIVLLDALMPNMDGREAACEIKRLAGDDMVPIIFLTSLKDADSRAGCLSAGGDDFMTKPYNRIILQAKITAFSRMRNMHSTLYRQKDQIELHNQHLIQEQEIAKKIFDNVAHSGSLNAPNIKHMLSPLAIFNGDVLVAAFRPSGSMMVLMGDFTGHGLPAAIGAMPLASTFYGMTQKGFSMGDILREINHKLKSILPPAVFCCACMVHINFRQKTMSVWNGGLPDCYLYRANEGKVVPVRSTHLPLGVVAGHSFNDDCEHFDMSVGDRFFMWSDGIHEALNEQGEMFGEERLLNVFQQNSEVDNLFDDIIASVNHFIGDTERDDDISVVEVGMLDPEAMTMESNTKVDTTALQGPMEWAMDYEVRPGTFRNFNPLPLLLNIVIEVPGLRPHGGTVYTILSELYSNALEHGILGLSSEMKASPSGFTEYYQKREEMLQAVQEGKVCIRLEHQATEQGGELAITVTDSGPGFNVGDNIDNESGTEGYCGRGIPLLRTLCKSFRYLGNGNQVEAVFEWVHE